MALTPLTIDVCSKVDFTDIIISDDSFITSVWSIMSCTVIQRTSSRKSWSGFQTILSYQLTRDALQCLTEIDLVIILLIKFQAIKYLSEVSQIYPELQLAGEFAEKASHNIQKQFVRQNPNDQK